MGKIDKAAAVAYADMCGQNAAAEQFGCSRRTIRRWCDEAKTGRDPELARKIEAHRSGRIRRQADIADEIFEATGRRILELINDCTDLRTLTYLLDKVGDIRLTRDALGAETEEEAELNQTDDSCADFGQSQFAQATQGQAAESVGPIN